jgi:coenzyme F420-reducing hydrogenase beta subunit
MSENSDKKIIAKNVWSEVVANNLCIGCGVCAALCPKKNLEIRFNEYGEYNAFEKDIQCAEGCSLCLKVCPFYDNGENEDTIGKKLFAETFGIHHRLETGYYLESYVGYSKVNGHRENGASGGLATWTLETLLRENLVDYAACVSSNKAPNKLFKFVICKTQEEVRACSRSCYYPVETSEVLEYILEHEGRYAIIGLPCVCKAIRLAMQVQPKLQQRVKFLLGLTCGQGKSKFFAEYACALGGGNPRNMNEIEFRVKNPKRPANEYVVRFVSDSGSGTERCEAVQISDSGFGNRYFTPSACNFCTDTFSELADATFMDAWLHDYSKDYQGHNIVIVRNKTLCDLIEQGRKNGQLAVDDLSIKKVIKSQKKLLYSKRNFTPERCRLVAQAGYKVPKTRPALLSAKLPCSERLLAKATSLISLKSREEWVACDKDLRRFQKAMTPYVAALMRAKLLNRLRRNPQALVGVLWRRAAKFISKLVK